MAKSMMSSGGEMNQPIQERAVKASEADKKLIQSAIAFDPNGIIWALERGANPNVCQHLGTASALMRACERPGPSALTCVELLLAAGADPNYKSTRGETAAMWAAGQGSQGSIERLAQAGARLDAKCLSNWGLKEFSAGSLDEGFCGWLADYVDSWSEAKELRENVPQAPRGRKPGL
jgi:hypothetical protein